MDSLNPQQTLLLVAAVLAFFSGVLGWLVMYSLVAPAREILYLRRKIRRALLFASTLGTDPASAEERSAARYDLKLLAADLLSAVDRLQFGPRFLARRMLHRRGLDAERAAVALAGLAEAGHPADRHLFRHEVEDALGFPTTRTKEHIQRLSERIAANWRIGSETEQAIRTTIDRAVAEGCEYRIVTARAVSELQAARPDLTDPDARAAIHVLSRAKSWRKIASI